MSEIREDGNVIQVITLGTGQEHSYVVGLDDVTEITHYKEPGPSGNVTWFKVWREYCIVARVNSAFVAEVLYEKE